MQIMAFMILMDSQTLTFSYNSCIYYSFYIYLKNNFQRGLTPDNLGFDIVGGKDDPVLPNDHAVYVNHVVKGSVADGKLK